MAKNDKHKTGQEPRKVKSQPSEAPGGVGRDKEEGSQTLFPNELDPKRRFGQFSRGGQPGRKS